MPLLLQHACKASRRPCIAAPWLPQLNYDARNPFDICSVTFTPIYRGNKVGALGHVLAGEPRWLWFGSTAPPVPSPAATDGSAEYVVLQYAMCPPPGTLLKQLAVALLNKTQFVEDPYTKARFQPEC